jgi:type I restriction-modification system DNA methylase subunit
MGDMLKKLGLVCVLLTAVLSLSAQDFATRYKREFKNDSLVQVITVSTKMLDKIKIANREDVIDKIDGIRIVAIDRTGATYCKKAQELLQKNTNRFRCCYENDARGVRLYTRSKNGVVLELVVLKSEDSRFKIVDIMGQIDEEFLRALREENGKENG